MRIFGLFSLVFLIYTGTAKSEGVDWSMLERSIERSNQVYDGLNKALEASAARAGRKRERHEMVLENYNEQGILVNGTVKVRGISKSYLKSVGMASKVTNVVTLKMIGNIGGETSHSLGWGETTFDFKSRHGHQLAFSMHANQKSIHLGAVQLLNSPFQEIIIDFSVQDEPEVNIFDKSVGPAKPNIAKKPAESEARPSQSKSVKFEAELIEADQKRHENLNKYGVIDFRQSVKCTFQCLQVATTKEFSTFKNSAPLEWVFIDILGEKPKFYSAGEVGDAIALPARGHQGFVSVIIPGKNGIQNFTIYENGVVIWNRNHDILGTSQYTQNGIGIAENVSAFPR